MKSMLARFSNNNGNSATATAAPETLTNDKLKGAKLYTLELLQMENGDVYISKPVAIGDAPTNDAEYKEAYPVFKQGTVNPDMVKKFLADKPVSKPVDVASSDKGSNNNVNSVDNKSSSAELSVETDKNDKSNVKAVEDDAKHKEVVEEAKEKIGELLQEALGKVNDIPDEDDTTYEKFIEENKDNPIIAALNLKDAAIDKKDAESKLKNAIEASKGFTSDKADISQKDIEDAAIKYVTEAKGEMLTIGGGNNYVYLSASSKKKYPKNVTFSKKKSNKKMNAKSFRKLQHILNN